MYIILYNFVVGIFIAFQITDVVKIVFLFVSKLQNLNHQTILIIQILTIFNHNIFLCQFHLQHESLHRGFGKSFWL